MPASNPFYSCIPAFKKQLLSVDAAILSDKPYPVRYFETIRQNLDYTLKIYADLLHQTQLRSTFSVAQTCLLDYGSGNGTLGLFAKFVGYGKVILNEPDPDFLNASVRLSELLQIQIVDFLHFDLQDSTEPFLMHKPDMLVASDVIEHIYDLDCFFQQAKLLNIKLVSGFTTASNPLHPIKRRKLMALQRQDEHKGNSGPFENHPSFASMRAMIIQETCPEFSTSNHEYWIRITRGLDRRDILKSIQHWRETGIHPIELDHPTNTCHPETGSWTERLLPLEAYARIAFRANFKVRISAGYYNTSQNPVRRFAAMLANSIIRKSGNRWAPFLFLFFQPQD